MPCASYQRCSSVCVCVCLFVSPADNMLAAVAAAAALIPDFEANLLIFLEPGDHGPKLVIQDNGCGMSEEQLTECLV